MPATDRYRVGIFINPGYWDTHTIRTTLGATIQRAGRKIAQYVVIGWGGRDPVLSWFNQAKAVLPQGSCLRYLDVPDFKEKEGEEWEGWEWMCREVDPNLFLYFAKDCNRVGEVSTIVRRNRIELRINIALR